MSNDPQPISAPSPVTDAQAATVSAPRLRFTYLYYFALTLATAISGSPVRLSGFASHALDHTALFLVITACLGRIWCSAFIAGYKNTRLITIGPYSLCRHPLYTFSFIGALGMGLATHSVMLALLTVLVVALLLVRAARREDRFLAHTYPYKFQDYSAKTPRFWPRWRNFKSADLLHLRTAIFRKAFLDAGAFVSLYIIIDTLRMLRESGVLPTLLEVP